ncbi:hypothetical protein HDU67_010326 [Dinochytrium kinnereticum]|nr:hypothetical protein HDU67_010326 [Dinochytrium kinnereticum]
MASSSESSRNVQNIGLAFGLTIAAGSASVLGGLLSLFVKRSQTAALGYALSFAAGVMIYISFTEIFGKMVDSFKEAKDKGALALPVAAAVPLTFFSGIAICAGLVWVTRLICPEVEALEEFSHTMSEATGPHQQETEKLESALTEREKKRLIRSSLTMALAIGLHNLPEGLATFIATVAEPSLGATVAIAIGIHNIPEGICVAIPIYYATNSRFKAVLWSAIASVAEPIGGIIGYVILKSSKIQGDAFPPAVFAVIFGIVAGIMVYISLTELLVTAYSNRSASPLWINTFLVAGMLIMALSIALFET